VKVFRVVLRVRHTLKQIGQVYAAMSGRMYGSWITGRSSHYAVGDVITDPAGIIESILREEMGLSSSYIDMPSFIAAENTSIGSHLNLHEGNQMLASDAIRLLAEQSTFAFTWTSIGTARLVNLTAPPASVDRTISGLDLNEPPLIEEEEFYAQTLVAEHTYKQETGKYYVTDTVTDALSTGKTFRATWPCLAGTSATTLETFLMNSGLWSTTHNVITLKTRHFLHADLELGDWISLDATTTDPVLRYRSASWSGVKFLVISVDQTLDMTTIKAIEL
jgi:hypothetical protein